MSAVVVTAIFTPVEGRLEAVLDALRPAIEAVQTEPGCELYAIHQHPNGDIVMIEKWSTVEQLDAHGEGPSVAALNTALAGLLESPAVVTRLVPIPVGDPIRGTL
ncbi:putative quinol monooxygenase [Mycetocola sp. JXN-3]|uniref:putative quinol monooxygenase n=1 Tax=Mycetocola sp. JXN-3 TaxID=2116510 RepID=UPI00165CF57B|nr:putative quinol monooxygenase [Mycetocola sp. JXN-3]